MLRKLSNKSSKKYLFFGIVMIFIAAISTVGVTYAWFTSGAGTENIFTAGTLDLEVINLNETSFSGVWAPGECSENQYEITNTGSKKMFVRASFDGFWKRVYHRNTATVTATYNEQTVTASNQAHYIFGDYSPPYNSNFNQEATQGFFDDNIPERTPFPMVWGSSETNNSNGPSLNETNSNSSLLTGYPEDCTGPKVNPVTGKKLEEEYPDKLFDNPNALNDPDAEKVQQYLGPSEENCGQLNSFKIDLDEDDLNEGNNPYTIDDDDVESSDLNSQFKVNIYKSKGNVKFAFSSLNHPVYHVYAKGGNQGGNFYNYYPTYDKGVYQDCGLSQPEGGWSHITFYYCEPQLSIEIKKQVSVDGGDSWEPADEAYGPELIGNQPQFRFWVTNTGNVPLTDIVIEDTVFDYIGTIASLPAGDSDGFIIDDSFWDTILDTGNVKIELCENDHNGYIKNYWVEIGDYFYYLHPIESEQSVTLCIKVCLTGEAGSIYDGAQFYLYSYFEAVQTTSGLVDDNWPDNPY